LLAKSKISENREKPKVTIGCCVKNGSATIDKAIKSIISQDFPHELIEVIFVDDGSVDNTFDIIRDYLPKIDMHVKVFRQKWKGLGPARNVVVENARGDYIVWVDADMILPQNHVRKQVEFMENNPDVGIAKARYGFLLNDSLVATLENLPCVINDYDSFKTESKYPGTGGSIYRVKAIRQVGGFDNCLVGVGEDQDAAYRIKEAGWSIKKSDAFFFELREQSWRDIWRKYYWYGYGNYFLYKKNKSIFKLCMMPPPLGFLAGILYSISAYKLIGKAVVFLLPLHYFFKKTAWFFGFICAYFSQRKNTL
jgi:glycosyltransferase involved in cell wall biosynthesis